MRSQGFIPYLAHACQQVPTFRETVFAYSIQMKPELNCRLDEDVRSPGIGLERFMNTMRLPYFL